VPSVESQVLTAYGQQVKGVIFDTSHNVPFFTSIWLDRGQP
jgi:peptide/nickel transport system substrate-binding protein